MGLLAEVNGRKVEGLAVTIDATAGFARVFEELMSEEVAFDISYPFSFIPQYPESNYYVALFGHFNWPQARNMTLRIGSDAVGAIFPLEVLCTGFAQDSSEEQRKATMEQYAALAFSKMCKGDVRGQPLIPAIQSSRTPHNISTFYHPDTVVVILTIDKFFPQELRQKHDSLDYNNYFINYLPSLYRYGLFPSPWAATGESAPVPDRYRQFHGAISEANERNIYLKPFSKHLTNGPREFLLTLFLEIDPNESNPFFRFFLYYQVFELWMQEIYVDAIGAFKGALGAAAEGDTTIFRDKLQVLNAALNEKNRLNDIIKANPAKECSPLVIDACNEVLERCKQQTSNSLHEALYSARNRLVHSFSQAKAAHNEFQKLADAMLDLICKTSVEYQPPPPKLF